MLALRAALNTSSKSSGSSDAPGRRWIPLLLEFGLIAAMVVLPFAWRVWMGAGELPAGDAWAYERIFDTYHTTGALRLVGWNDITLVGMIPVTSLWVAIVGYGALQLHLLGSVMCAVALYGLRSLLITFDTPRRWAALVLFGGYGGMVGIAGTYLSDTFAIAGCIWAVALAARVAHNRASHTPLFDNVMAGMAALAAAFGFLVRQQMVVGALAAAWLLWTARSRAPRAFAIFVALFVVVATPVYLWRSGLEHGGQIEFDLHPRGVLAAAEGLVIAQGAALFSAALWLRGAKPIGRQALAIGATVTAAAYAALCASWSVAEPAHPLVLGIQEQFGLIGGALLLVPLLAAATAGWAWAFTLWGGTLPHAGSITTPPFTTPPTTTPPLSAHPLGRLALLGLAVEFAVILTTGAYFTRYSLFTVSLAYVAILARPLKGGAIAVAVTIALMIGSFWELDHSIAPTGAVLAAGRITACLGIPPEHVDATFSWDGKYFQGIASVYHGDLSADDGLPLTQDWSTFPSMDRDAVLTPHDPGLRDSWLVLGPLETSGLLPGNRQEWWLTVRRSAIAVPDPTVCRGA